MYDYVNVELPSILSAFFPVDVRRISVAGHSMGGHGALISALKNPGKFKSVSAFSPICNPTQCPWGKKAFEVVTAIGKVPTSVFVLLLTRRCHFQGYLGSVDAGKDYDATLLMEKYEGEQIPILIDQVSLDTPAMVDIWALGKRFMQCSSSFILCLQGTADNFLKNQLCPEKFAAAAAATKYPIRLRMQSGYDHSYYFISTFMRDHIEHHARALGLTGF